MFYESKKSLLVSCILYGFAISVAHAADEKQLLITAVAGKEICQSMKVVIGEIPVKSELCVTQGSFSHDQYNLKIDDEVQLKGIDDETSLGITSTYKNHKLALKCVAQNVFPRATPEATLAEVQKAMPNSSQDEVVEMAKLLGTAPGMGMEIGRLCTASTDGSSFMTVQVMFK
ncbi:MAG TPA: hypothetical protein VFP33_06830 [Gallionella sp.]|nr:hypothetical protein [Gallionella sp.]